MLKQTDLSLNFLNCASLLPDLLDYEKYVSQDLRFGMVGFGKMGILHSSILNLLKPNCVEIIVDKSRLMALSASRIVRNVKFYRDLDKMLRTSDFSAIYVTTSAQSHYPIVSKLLDSGVKYVFVEKPPTVNLTQFYSLIQKVKNDQVVMVGLQKRFALPFRHAKLLISERAIGEVEKVSAYIKSSDIMVSTSRFNSIGRGVNLDLGIHLLDLLVWMFNVNNVESARCRTVYSGVDDYFEALLKNQDGLECNVEMTWSSPDHRLPETCLEVYGSNGKLKVTEDCLKVKFAEDHKLLNNQKEFVFYKPHYYRDTPPVNLADPEYTLEDMHFICSVGSSVRPLTDLRNLTKVMGLIDEMYKIAGQPAS